MKTVDIDQGFYDLRWSTEGEITQRERDRLSTTIGMVPANCQTVLDVGAGNGFLSNELVARGKALVAVDISEVALARVKAPTLLRSASQITGVDDRAFDLVLCTEMLEHLDDDTYRGALHEFNRIAEKSILITVPNRENMGENIACCADCGQPFHIWGHRRRFTPTKLQSLFPDFTPEVITSFGNNLRRHNPLLLWMRMTVARAWAHDESSPCPHCHSFSPARPKHPRLANFCSLVNSNLPHLPHRPWLLALDRRK
jgi:ubiquinone/menaquinone biosynthesis C-methylase UbiE